MKKLVSILAIVITVPSFATDITNSSDCDNTTLGTYSAPVDMEAKWTANTINLQWYDDANDSTPTSTTCQYSSTIALPTEPNKPGYNFAGWQLRPPFDLTTLAEYVNQNSDVGTSKNFAGTWCFYTNELIYEYSDVCTDPVFSDLNNGEWTATFDYGTLKGVSLCSSTSVSSYPTLGIIGTPDTTGTGDTKYCWCRVTGFSSQNNGVYAPCSDSVWAGIGTMGDSDAESCMNGCANLCRDYTRGISSVRRALYGITQ